jgi:intracellular septation protein A/isopentenyldiphosphate isomerase
MAMNLTRLLKSLVPSLIPLLVYVLADAVLGERMGIIVGVGVGVAEFLFVLARDRKPDPFVAADTGLLAAMGALSFLSGNDLWFKLKPAVLELVFGAVLALLLVLPVRYLKAYLERQLRGIAVEEASIPLMRRSIGGMLAVLAIHAGLTTWAAVALSTKAWGFVSGVLLYILFGILILAEFLRARSASRRPRPAAGALPGEPLLPIVDEEGRLLGQAPERLCHAAPGGQGGPEAGRLLHPSLRLLVVNSAGGLLLRRPVSATQEAGQWDLPVGCHVEAGEDLAAALSRGLHEGLGLEGKDLEAALASARFSLRYRRDAAAEAELVYLFFLPHDAPLAVEGGGGAWRRFGPEEVSAEAKAGGLAPRFLDEYRRLAEAAREGPGASGK